MTEAVFIHSAELEKYQYPPDHPFNTSRARKTRQIVNSVGLLSGEGRSEVPPEPAERIVLKKFHSGQYLHVLKEAAEGCWLPEALNMGLGTSDCPVFEGLYDYAVLATGGTAKAVGMILSGEADIAFNPSGGYHHAAPERASGFCYINDVAIACVLLAEARKRVLYLDVDVHHGDGVAFGFYDRSDVMTISLHENPRVLFPGTGFVDEIGAGQGKGYCVNVPLPVGTYDEAYMKAFESVALPLIKKFNPDVFVFELGADALAGDPLAHICLTNSVYADVIEHLLSFDRPILATGGGGYDVDNTTRAWALAWSILAGGGATADGNVGAGGVMLASTDWEGGLRDRTIVIGDHQRNAVEPAVDAVIEKVQATIFGLHGL